MYKQKKIAYNKYKRKVKEEKMKVIDKIENVRLKQVDSRGKTTTSGLCLSNENVSKRAPKK